MASEILHVLGDKPAEAKPKAKASAKTKAAGKKKPAAAAAEKEEPPTKKAKGTLPFPGEGPAVRYKNVTVYICPSSFSYRVKLAGDKKDKAFSWKVDGAKTAWGRVRQHVLSLV